MSQINVDTIKKADGTGSLTVPAESGTVITSASPSLGRRNMIINGAMDINQRYGGTAHNIPAYTDTYVLDRWVSSAQPSANLFSVQQVAASGDALAAGFEKCTEIASLTNHTQTSGDIYAYKHRVEGFNCKHLQWGTSNAKSVTLSFWVKSSKTGTHGGSFLDAANAYTYPFTYTVNTVDTWEYKTVSLDGPTSGTFNKDSSIGLQISFGLCVGSSFSGTSGSWSATANIFGATGGADLLDSSSNTWSITGVQLEVGDVATPFEHRTFQDEWLACMRYFQKSYRYNHYNTTTTLDGAIGGYVMDGTNSFNHVTLQVPMRDAPNVTLYSRTGVSGKITGGSFSEATGTVYQPSHTGFNVAATSVTGPDTYIMYYAEKEL